MAKRIQFRGGTTAQHSTFTGAIREITVDTDKDTLVVHDGTTVGGFTLARESIVTSGLATKVDKNANIVAGTGTKVTYDSKGLVTGSTTLSASDIPSLDASKITTGTLSLNTTGSAAKITTTRSIGITGDITWSTSFDGSANVTGVGTLANSGVTAGTYKSVTVDSKGRVTNGTNPTTLSGYGITDAYTKTEIDNTKVTKVTSTDNAIVRFDGTTGAVQDSSVIIDDNGNMGINNAAPLQKLHVGGSIIAGDTTYKSMNQFIGAILNNNSTTPSLDIRRWNGSGTNHGVIKIAGNAYGAMLFFVDTKSTNVEATTEMMRIDSNGNLLIGTSVTSGLDKVQIEGTFSSKAVKAFTGIDLNTLKTRTEVCSVTSTCTNLPIAETGYLEVFMFDSNSQWVMQRFTAIGYPNASNHGRTYVRNWMNNSTWSAWVEK